MLTLRHRTQVLLVVAMLGIAGMLFGNGWFGLRPLVIANALIGLLVANALAVPVWRLVGYRRARA
jgi:uncharacterized membrane protein YccC